MSTTRYSAHVELDRKRVTADQAETMHEALAAYSPAVGTSPRGYLDAQLAVPAETLSQATTTAVAVVEAAARAAGITASAIATQVMTWAEFDDRQGHATPWADLEQDPVIGSAEAAQILGVSRQRIMQLRESGALASVPIGARAHGFSRAEVERLAANR